MPYIPAPGVAKVTLTYEVDNQKLQNTFHVAKVGEWSALDLASLNDIFLAWEAGDGNNLRAAAAVLREVRSIDLTTEDGAYSIADLGSGSPGLVVSEIMPANVTYAMQLATDRRGRGRQGRIFVIGLAESQCVGNNIAPGSRTDLNAGYTALMDAVEAGSEGVLAVLHSVVGGLPVNPKTWTPVQAILGSDSTLDSQVNRLPNHKRHKRPTP